MALKGKRLIALTAAVVVIALGLAAVFSEIHASNRINADLTRVACLGDSITQDTVYPDILQSLLGNDSEVGNFGYTGASVNFHSNNSYYFTEAYMNAKSFQPTTVIILLGTNDARTGLATQINNTFVRNYERMINRTQEWSSKPMIFLVKPPPLFKNTLDLNQTFFVQDVLPGIDRVAKDTGLPIIDLYTPLLNHPEYFSDGVHPNNAGAQTIADLIYKAIK
jgi:acyl-CoA thioesterase-1